MGGREVLARVTLSSVLVWLALAAAFIVVLSLVCNSSRRLEADEYFARLDEMQGLVDERIDEIKDEISGAFEYPEKADETIIAFAPVIDEIAQGYGRLSPPAELEGAHEQLMGASREAAELYKDVAADLKESGSQEESDRIIEGIEDENRRIFDATTEACEELERFAAREGIETSLNC